MPSFREVATGKKDKKLGELHPPMAPPKCDHDRDEHGICKKCGSLIPDISEGFYRKKIGLDESEQYSVRNHYDDAFESLAHATPKPAEIDFERIAKLMTFERFLIDAIKIIVPGFKGVPTRAKREVMKGEFDKRVKQIKEVSDIVTEMRRAKVGDYREVMKELKEKLAQKKEEVEHER